MLVFRIIKSAYANDLSGTGAALYGGRWNPVGTPMLYTSMSLSLALLEYLAHNMHVLKTSSLTLLKLEIPNGSCMHPLEINELPKDWKSLNYDPTRTAEIGQKFIREKKCYMLKVPSAIVPGEFNMLLNPAHPDHLKLRIADKIEAFEIDDRIRNFTPLQ